MIPYNSRILPELTADPVWATIKFDVSRPVWAASVASSSLCFFPFVQQVFNKASGVMDVPVSHWAQLSPCGRLLVAMPFSMERLDSGQDWTCSIEHFHLGSGRLCTVLEEQIETSEDMNYRKSWMDIAWLPHPPDAQMYAVSGPQGSLVHLIDGKHDTLCCTWHLASSRLVEHGYQGIRYRSSSILETPMIIAMQWLEDGRCLAISAADLHPILVIFDQIAPDELEQVSCCSPFVHTGL